MQIHRYPELASLIDATSTHLTSLLSNLQRDGGVARIVLTGGTAGIALLERLAQQDASTDAIDWSRVHVFFGDERNVPTTHPDSNEGQAREALLSRVAIPEGNIHGYGLHGGSMDEAVAEYAHTLDKFAPDGFDLHLLGMGAEGHINSLFPDTDAVREDVATVIAVTDSPKPPAERASLTLPAVRRADRVWLLVSGAEKAEAAASLVTGADPVAWPCAGAQGKKETVLYITADAAAKLP